MSRVISGEHLRRNETFRTRTNQNGREQIEALEVRTGGKRSAPEHPGTHAPLSGPRDRGDPPRPSVPGQVTREEPFIEDAPGAPVRTSPGGLIETCCFVQPLSANSRSSPRTDRRSAAPARAAFRPEVGCGRRRGGVCRGTGVGQRGRGRSKSANRIDSDDDLSVAWVRALLRGEARIPSGLRAGWP